MNKLRTFALLAAVLCSLAVVSGALAQTSANYDLTWHVLGSGGARMDSTTYVLEGTIAQSLAGQTDSDHYALTAGYWYPCLSDRYAVYLPLVVRAQP